MTTTLKLLENIGQCTSLNEFDSVGQLLAQQEISEEAINDLINSNIPLVCAWEPEDDDEKKEEKEEEEDTKGKIVN